MDETILCLESVGLLSNEGRTVFSGLSLAIRRGERVALQTGAGSGATALLRLAAGLAHCGEGRIFLDGVLLHPHAFDHPFLKRGALGWVPTEGGLLVNLSLLANVALPLRFVKGMSQPEAEGTARKALERLGLESMASQRPHGLESRERWLGALARACVMEPELWLVDRPPSDLEPAMVEAARSLISPHLENPDVGALVVWEDCLHLLTPTRSLRLEGGLILPEDVP